MERIVGNILMFLLIVLAGFAAFYAFPKKKITDHQRLLTRLRDPELNLDTLIAELRYAKTLNVSQRQRLAIFEQALAILAAHPQDMRCRNFASDFGQWYGAISHSDNSSLKEEDLQNLQREIWARYQELVVSL